jgi:nitrite reductase/ring-hydroxylating ferredoxin subunit
MDRPPAGTVLANVDRLPDKGGVAVDWQDTPLILVRVGADVRCYVNVCPHAGRSLALPDGRVFVHKDTNIICPVHGATFDAASGACTGGPAGDPLTAIAIDIVGNEVVVA